MKTRDFLPGRRGCFLVSLAVIGLLLMVPVHGYQYVSGSPEILSNQEIGIIIVPAWIFAGRKPAAQLLWCSFLGWFAAPSCLPEMQTSGLHVWFLRETGVEYHAIAPFPYQSAAYVYNGKLRWFRGREAWEWEGQGFRKLDDSEAEMPFRDQRSIADLMRAEGWTQHRIDNEHQVIPAGAYRVRYIRPVTEADPTEMAIEEGPVAGTLYSRVEKWHFTGLMGRIPEFSIEEQQTLGNTMP